MKSNCILIRILIATWCVGSVPSAVADEPRSSARENSDVRVVRVLTIGNSFAQNACRYLEQIAESHGRASEGAASETAVRIEIGTANLGGCTLERHATLMKASAQDAATRPYRNGDGRRYSLQEALQDRKWDYVTLQQMSALSYKPSTYHPHIDQLVATIRELAPSAEILIHQTWAYRPDSPILKSEGITQLEMYDRLRDAYDGVAKQFGCQQIPVGTAFQLARADRGHQIVVPDPDYDYRNPTYPELPDQTNSLVTGWRWNNRGGEPKLALDFKHGNERGCYLAGLVWFESLTGIDGSKTSFRPEGVSAEDADFFRVIAHRAHLNREQIGDR